MRLRSGELSRRGPLKGDAMGLEKLIEILKFCGSFPFKPMESNVVCEREDKFSVSRRSSLNKHKTSSWLPNPSAPKVSHLPFHG